MNEQVNDVKETVNSFLDKIAQAQIEKLEWVETSPEVIQHYNRRGLNGAKFFIYNGIKVCEFGKVDEIENEQNAQIGQKIHGPNEGKVLNQ